MFYRAYTHYSKNISAEYIPDDLFHFCCLPALNIKEFDSGYSDHYFMSQLLPDELQSKIVFRNIEEVYYDQNHNVIKLAKKSLDELLDDHEEILLKPSLETDQNKPIQVFKKVNGKFLNKNNDILNLQYLEEKYHKNYVAELPISLHSSFLKFESFGLSALRFYMYRSPISEKTDVLGCCLISGKNGFNEYNLIRDAGVFQVNEEGRIKLFAKQENDGRIRKLFRDEDDNRFPKMEDLIECAKKVAEVNYYHRVIAIDLTLDEDMQIKLRGIRNHTFEPIALQFAGKPFFGHYTDEVIDYCSGWVNQR
ncbi:MAG: hypothetical protein EA359_12200 [Balneolaceae bacterium]|nr:MAG: hypothetical protein EA359_12200 [Balneolaceae bacterium]